MLVFVSLSPGLAPVALAQNYPTKPIRLIVAFAPGGGSDILAREFTPKLTEHFGQNFIVDNRGGAGGSGPPSRTCARARTGRSR